MDKKDKFAYSWFKNPLDRHTSIITQMVKLLNCKKYLELGIYDGKNIHAVGIHCDDCTGVDIVDNTKYAVNKFILNSTDGFFKENKEKFDVIFIDADHNFESVKIDFINSLDVLNEFGVIIIHDTDPICVEYNHPGFCGDSYKIIDWIDETYSDLNMITLPITEAGLTIVNRKNDRRVNKY